MTVKAITQLNWFWFIWFSHWLLEMVSNTILPIRRSSVLLFTRNQVDLVVNQSCNWLVSCYLDFKVTNVIGFNFAPTWFVKTSRFLREFHWFVVG